MNSIEFTVLNLLSKELCAICMDEIPVLLETREFAIVSKPAKLLMHRSFISNQDHEFLLQKVRDIFARKVWPVNRLDRGTSGCVLFAFSADIASELAKLQEENQIDKCYVAICRGFTPEELKIDHPLKPPVDPYLRIQRIEPQSAITYLKRIATAEIPLPYESFPTTRLSLNELRLETGRRHQIRKHLKWISHPIIGDATYGKGKLNREMAKYFGIERLLLHCRTMVFNDPFSKKEVEAIAPYDAAFITCFQKLGWKFS